MTDHSAIEPRPFDPVTLYKALFLAVVVVFVATPLLATVLGGFKSLGELRTNPFGLPQGVGVASTTPPSCSRSATGSCCATPRSSRRSRCC